MGTVIWRGATTLIEQANSPQFTFGDKIQQVRIFKGPFALCLSSAPYKGALGGGSAAGYRVAESTVIPEKGRIGTLTIKYEVNGDPGGATLPIDEFDMTPQKTEKALEDHPRYGALTRGTLQDIRTCRETAQDSTAYLAAAGRIAALPGATHTLALELWDKLQRGFTQIPIYPPSVKITAYSWVPPASLSGGGYREVPPAFIGVSLPSTILGLPVNWLREADAVGYNGTHYHVTKSWIGGPDLDTDVYP